MAVQPEPPRTGQVRLAEDVRAWLPTSDLGAHEAIVGLLARVYATGVDPIAALRDAAERWFGRDAAAALPPPVLPALIAAPPTHVGASDAAVMLEPLPSLRRPTMWPQRPKRLPNELFSSWLRRAALAAGVTPHCFALDVLGKRLADPDRDVSDATLHRLALATGQNVKDLARGTLRPARSGERSSSGAARRVGRPIPVPDRLAAAQDVALRDGRLVLARASCTRDGRPRPLLQYCPRCLAEDEPPRFYRGWRLVHEVACVRHRCRLLDTCRRCGAGSAGLDPLAQRTASLRPTCAACEAALADTVPEEAPETILRIQRGLACLFHYLAVHAAPETQRPHLDRLARRLAAADRSVAARERALARLQPELWREWFGLPRPSTVVDDTVMNTAAMGWSYDRLFGRARSGRPNGR